MKGLLFTYIMTYGGSLVSLFNPYHGVLIYVSFSIIKPESMWFWSVPQGNYSRTVALALLLGWMLQGFGAWDLGRGRPIIMMLMGFWGWAVFGTALAQNTDVALGFVESFSKIALPLLVGISCIDSVAKIKQLAWVVLLSEGYVALELNLYYLSGWNRVYQEGFGFMDNNCVAISMVTCVGLSFFLGLGARKLWQKALALFAAALMMHVVMISFSRGGQLSLAITMVVAFFLIPKKPKHYLIFILGVILTLRMAGPQVRERFMTSFSGESERDASADSRVKLWGACWDSMLKRPVLGVGPDHWPLVVQEYGWKPGKEAHTLWLQTGAEMGFPGLLFLLGFYGLSIIKLWPLASEKYPVPDPWMHDAARMVIASLVGFCVSAQFVSLEALEVPYFVVLIGVGVLKLATRPGVGEERSRYHPDDSYSPSRSIPSAEMA